MENARDGAREALEEDAEEEDILLAENVGFQVGDSRAVELLQNTGGFFGSLYASDALRRCRARAASGGSQQAQTAPSFADCGSG